MEMAQQLTDPTTTHVANIFYADLMTQPVGIVETYRKTDPTTYEFASGNRVVRLHVDDDADPDTVLCSVEGNTMVFRSVAHPSVLADVYAAIDKAITWLG